MLQRIAVTIGTWWQCAMELLPLHHCHQAVPHLDKLSLYLSSPPPVSCPPPSHHYFPLPGLSSPHSSPQSLDLLHAASIPVTALLHIIQSRNMYAVAGSSLQGGTSTAEVGVESSLSLTARSTTSSFHWFSSLLSPISPHDKCKVFWWHQYTSILLCRVLHARNIVMLY